MSDTRKAFERFPASGTEPAARLLRITEAIAVAVSTDEVFDALVDCVADAIEASSTGLWLVDEERGHATLVKSRGYSEPARQQLQTLPLDMSPSLPAIDCIRTRRPIWIPSQADLFERYPQLASVATPGRSYRVACLPLVANRRVLGSLGITIEEAREESVEERELLLLVARYATQAIERLRILEAERRSRADADAASLENSRLYEESVAARTRAEELYRFAQAVVSAERLEQVFEAAIAAIEGSLGVGRSAVLTLDEEGVMRFRAWRNLSDAYRHAVEGHSPWSRNDESPRPVLVPDAQRAPTFAAYQPLFRSEGIGALAFIPLTSGGRLLGKFMLYYEAPHAFVESEIDMARALANHLGSVVARFSALAKLEETIRYNELFAGVLAHDLRNPLGAMMTAAQLVLMRREGEGALSDRVAKPLSRIVSSGHRMATMIEQLLDFTQIRSGGGIPIAPHETNLIDLCGQAVGELELGHPEWTIQREAVGDLRGEWDSDRLLQVLSNLVANACQHGVAGSPVLVRLDGSAGDRVEIEVHNRGAIPASLVPNLFDPFRSTRHRRDQSRGLGLGLFIVREIVRGHGGSVDVVSNELEGTTFVVHLPRRAERRGEDEV